MSKSRKHYQRKINVLRALGAERSPGANTFPYIHWNTSVPAGGSVLSVSDLERGMEMLSRQAEERLSEREHFLSALIYGASAYQYTSSDAAA